MKHIFYTIVATLLLAPCTVAQPLMPYPPRDAIPPAPPEASDRILPINLATALQLSNARPIDVQIAARQVDLAAKSLERAELLWVPNLTMGANYFRHEGGQQNFTGDILRSSRGSLGVGVGPNILFSTADAIYAPLAAKQDLRARKANRQAIENDNTLAVAEAYFTVQQARGELAGALLALTKAQEIAAKTEKLAEGLAPPIEAQRARIELARRKQAATNARELWRLSSADLVRLLRLEPGTLLDPMEPAFLPVTLIDDGQTLDALIVIGLSSRPELAGQQAVVQAALTRLKQEKMRPLIPSLALRSASTNPAGSIGFGGFGGGPNDRIGNFGTRFDVDVQVLWEFSALGFGNRVRVGERRVEHQTATLELFRTQDRIAAEITQAHTQIRAAAERMTAAEPALREAIELIEKSLLGMGQTRRVGEYNTLIVRPQEVVAAVQALGQANIDFYSAIADYNRAQFRLFRALGHPAQCLSNVVPAGELSGMPQASPAGPRVIGMYPAVPVSVQPPAVPQPSPRKFAQSTLLPKSKQPMNIPQPIVHPNIPEDPIETPTTLPPLPLIPVPSLPPMSRAPKPQEAWPAIAVQVLNNARFRVEQPIQQTTWNEPTSQEPRDLPIITNEPNVKAEIVPQPIAETPRPTPTIQPPKPTITPPAMPKEEAITWNKAPESEKKK